MCFIASIGIFAHNPGAKETDEQVFSLQLPNQPMNKSLFWIAMFNFAVGAQADEKVKQQAQTSTSTTPPSRAVTSLKKPNIRTHPPKYPPSAIRERKQGTVLVKIVIDTEGVPEEITVERSSGHQELDESAIEAAKSWRFDPLVKDGKPERQIIIMPITFNLGTDDATE